MSRLFLDDVKVTASEALELDGCTGGSVDVVVLGFDSLRSIQVEIQVGNDRENWSTCTTALFVRAGFARFRFRGVAARYLRVCYRATALTSGLGLVTTSVVGKASAR